MEWPATSCAANAVKAAMKVDFMVLVLLLLLI